MKDPDRPLDEAYFQSEREYMVEHQIARRGIRDMRVLDAMRSVPRHEFVPPEYRHAAYADGPLPLGSGQTISQPYIVALMSELLELVGNEKVLEVGTGSGYQAALLAELARDVYSIERHAGLAHSAESILQKLGYDNVYIRVGDGSMGLPEFSPYQGIIVTAAAPAASQKLLDQLADGGRLVIPVGSRSSQFLERWQRQGESFSCENVLSVCFVPLIGDEGWKE